MSMIYPEHGMDNQVLEHIGGLIGGNEKIHRDLAQYIAFQMHNKGGEQGREISEHGLREMLNSHPDYKELCDDFVELTRMRGTLMEERFGMYRFIHLAFQEFLVARYLAEVFRSEEKIVEFFQQGLISENWWREVILLTVGYLSINSSATAVSLIRLLAGLDQSGNTNSIASDMQVVAAGLAWTAVSEWPEAPPSIVKEIPDRFLDIFHDDALFPNFHKRVEAGNLLGRLGDPRFRADYWYLPGDDMLGFVEIGAGDFLMGDDDDEGARPRHFVHLKQYFIGRYPVTVAQYRAFVDASGYKTSADNSLDGVANHPGNWMRWYNAMAYCNWLNDTLESWPDLPADLRVLFNDKGYHIALPSEAQWEKAARGEDGHTYPWGAEKPDSQRANYNETGIKTTSPVGCFPDGTSPNGLVDCSGNVQEWTRSLWGEDWQKPNFVYPYDTNIAVGENVEASREMERICRGGSYCDSGGILGCAHRNWNNPVVGYWVRGFRIVLAPNSPSGL